MYVASLGRPPVFGEDEGALDDPRRAMAVGIEAEREAILFYSEPANLVSEETTKKILYDLLRQEKMHLVELRDRLDEDWS